MEYKFINYKNYFINIIYRLVSYNKKINNIMLKINIDDVYYVYKNMNKNFTNYKYNFIKNHIYNFQKIINKQYEFSFENILLLHKTLNQNIIEINKLGIIRENVVELKRNINNKKLKNIVIGNKNIEEKLKIIIEKFNIEIKNIKKIEEKIKKISEFYIEFENIHPFSDGNGRVGRFIILIQCIILKIPFIVIDKENKKILDILLINERKKYESCFDFFKFLIINEKKYFKKYMKL